MAKRPKVLLVDCYDTLVTHRAPLETKLREFGRTMNDYSDKMGQIALLADTGRITYAQFRGYFNALISGDVTFDLIDYLAPIRPMHSLVASAQEAGIVTGLFTNVSDGALSRTFEADLLPAGMNPNIQVESHRLGVRKPHYAAYKHATRIIMTQLGVEAADVVFVDNEHTNVVASRSFGLPAEEFDVRNPLEEAERIAEVLHIPYTHPIVTAA